MARSKSFFGLRRGSAGGFTYSKGIYGEQITRAKAETVRNPQTKAQMAQRMLFSAVGHLASKFGSIVNHSTQGSMPKAAALADFRKINLQQLRPGTLQFIADRDPNDISFAVKEFQHDGVMYRNLVLSTGDLPKRNMLSTNGTTWIDSAVLIPTGSNITWRKFIEDSGLEFGDWLTFVVPLISDSPWSDQVFAIDFVGFVRFELRSDISADVLNGNALLATMPQVFNIVTNLPSDLNLSAGLFTVGEARGLGVRFEWYADTINPDVIGLIHSRTDEGGKHRSPSTISSTVGNGTIIVNSWPIGQALILDGGDGSWDVGEVPIYQPGGTTPRPRPIAPSEDTPEP